MDFKLNFKTCETVKSLVAKATGTEIKIRILLTGAPSGRSGSGALQEGHIRKVIFNSE